MKEDGNSHNLCLQVVSGHANTLIAIGGYTCNELVLHTVVIALVLNVCIINSTLYCTQSLHQPLLGFPV